MPFILGVATLESTASSLLEMSLATPASAVRVPKQKPCNGQPWVVAAISTEKEGECSERSTIPRVERPKTIRLEMPQGNGRTVRYTVRYR